MQKTKVAGDAAPEVVGHVLIVDDNPNNSELLQRLLTRQGHTSIIANDGLEALAVLEKTTVDVVLLDVMMPNMDGYETLERIKTRPDWQHIPVVMISALTEMDSIIKCIDLGADDYLPKPFNTVLLRARVGACIEKKLLRDQERRSYAALQATQAKLAGELAEAAAYVQALLPAPISGEISTDWISVPSMELGGDLFGYRWLDDDRFAIYLFDVSGHGVGAALLSVSVANALRAETLGDVAFDDPGSVLSALNDAFQMDLHNNMYLTLWYGVYARSSRELVYCSGGHPPAFLSPGPERKTIQRLRTPGMPIGNIPELTYPTARCTVPPGSLLCLYSDGAYEVSKAAGGPDLTLDEFAAMALLDPEICMTRSESLFARVKELHGSAVFLDDVSILWVNFE